MEKKIEKYGLRLKKTGKLLGFSISSNEGRDFCGEYTVELEDYSDQTWLVDDPIVAEYARNFNTPWYNSSMESPQNHFKAEDLEVVKISSIVTETTLDIKIPSVKQYFEVKYKKSEPHHYEYLMKELKSHPRDLKYDLYELQEAHRKGIITITVKEK